MMRKIGVLTSGGDAPGMNAAVMSIARSAAAYGMPLIGIKHGYNGLLRKSTSIKDDLQELYLIGFEYGRDVQYVVFRIGRF